MIRSAIRSAVNFIRYRNPAERKARKYIELFGFYFWQNLEMVDFSQDIALSELQARTLCGYVAGFIDTVLMHMGEEVGSASAFIAIHIILTDEFGDRQKDVLVAEFLGRDTAASSADYGRAAEIGSVDASAFLDQKQKFNFGKFLYQEFRSLCKVTNADLAAQLVSPRKV